MTILYKVQNTSGIKEATWQQRSFLNVSNKNITAFSISQDVFVCDITSPWRYWKVCSVKNVITSLEWNGTGELLLIATKGGIVEIWSTRDYTLNTWDLLYRAMFSNEDILNAKFFDNGKNFYFNSQKKDLSLYAEKFERLDHRATLVRFGNAPTEGFIAVTSSGLVGVAVISPNHISEHNQWTELTPVFHRLNIQRAAFTCISTMQNYDGTLTLAVYGRNCPQAIFCFKLTIRYNFERNLVLNCEALPTVFTNSTNLRLIRSCIINNEDVLLVSFQQRDHSSTLEQWNLTKKAQMVHKLLQKNKPDIVHLECWENTAKMYFSSEIREVCVSKFFADFMQISVVLRDAVQVFEPGLKMLGSTAFERLVDERECHFITGDVTHMNQILFIIDNQGQLYAMQLPHCQLDKGYKPLSLQVSMLEYCIVTGIDSTDILLLNPLNVEILVEKLTENFTRQHSYTRQFYYSNFLSLKSTMCRMLSKQQDFDLIMLHSISITFKSLLRPSDLNSQDKGPADNLSIILSEPISDVDKVLVNLDPKDFTVEPPTLQSLQQLIQWVADLGLNILNRLPEEAMKPKLSKKQGYDIGRDIAAINSIRELLVMIRIWGLLNAQCLPIYTKSVENIDVLLILFRLLSRLTQNPSEPDEILLDECSLLSSQVLVPTRDLNTPTTSLLSTMKSFPLLFTVGVTPPALQELQFEEVVFNRGIKDGVTNLHLGSKAEKIRNCSRCGFVNSQKNPKTSALKAWCNRWLYCVCGGFWKV